MLVNKSLWSCYQSHENEELSSGEFEWNVWDFKRLYNLIMIRPLHDTEYASDWQASRVRRGSRTWGRAGRGRLGTGVFARVCQSLQCKSTAWFSTACVTKPLKTHFLTVKMVDDVKCFALWLSTRWKRTKRCIKRFAKMNAPDKRANLT